MGTSLQTLSLKTVIGPYGHTRALLDGTVSPAGPTRHG